MIQVTSYWKTGNRIHKVKVSITTASGMTVPQTKQHFIDKSSSTVVVMLMYRGEKRPIIHIHVKDYLVKVHFSNL